MMSFKHFKAAWRVGALARAVTLADAMWGVMSGVRSSAMSSVKSSAMLRVMSSVRSSAMLSVMFGALSGCAGTSPPVQWLQLRAAVPEGATTRVGSIPSPFTWQLALPVRVPDYLDRDALLVPQGQAGLQAVAGYRWAEPLRESVPRLLRQDLATLLGQARVWVAPLPPGLVIQRQLRVELLALEANASRTAVDLRARWSVADAAGSAAPRVDSVVLNVPSAGSDADSLAAAHRMALWLLAQRIAAQ